MKKTSAILIMLLVLLSGLSAGTVKASSTLNLTTTLTNDMFAVEHIGFTKSDNRDFIANETDMNDYPKDMETDNEVKIEYKSGDRNPSVSFYLFYKVTGVEGLILDLQGGDKLSNGNEEKDIDYGIVVHDGSPFGSQGNVKHWTAEINLSTKHYYEANLYQIDVVTTTPLNASYVSDKEYTTNLTLTISSR